ncbi:VWA domain-containing protein [Clostridium sp. UBA1056]|uniref:vWA domain-containing protein n=1 Tax=unclassified Clostridium TaxID=2614128 RepID=UPI003217311E
MSFLNIWPLVFLITIPFLILLYILKEKSDDLIVSSSIFWEEIYKTLEVNSPFEKLKKNIMLLFQILITLLIILALMNPFLKFMGKEYSELIIVIDTSASMLGISEDKTCIDRGKDIAKEYVDSSSDGTKISIITANKETKTLVADSENKALVKEKIDSITESFNPGDLNSSLKLIESMTKDLENYKVLFITDKEIEIGELNGQVIYLDKNKSNISIDNIAHKKENGKVSIISTITNRGNVDYSGDFYLYKENNLLEATSLELKKGEETTLNFNIEDTEISYLKGEISGKDAILEDNTFYHVMKDNDNKKILLVSDKNVFLEKALSVVSQTEVVKTNDINNISEKDNYDLYIFDGMLGENIPEHGNILIVNPSENNLFAVLGEEDGGEASVVGEDIPKYLQDMTFIASKIKKVQVPTWAKSLVNVGDSSILFLGKHNNQKVAVANFDFHNTDLPLKAEFPMLINYICEELVENNIVNSNYIGGEDIKINGSSAYDELIITSPSGRVRTIENNNILNENLELGVYSIEDSDNSLSEMFSINFPSTEEGNIIDDTIENVEARLNENSSTKGRLDITPYIISVIIILIITEWILYNKGY